MRKPETNREFIARLAGYDPMRQAFIISAIDSYARQVAESEPMEHGFIDGVAWQQYAQAILRDIGAREERASQSATWERWLARVEEILAEYKLDLTIGDTDQARDMYDDGQSVEDCAEYFGAYCMA